MSEHVLIPHESYGQRDALARPHEGGIRISGIGYYDDEVTLTVEQLRTLGFRPYRPEGAIILEVDDGTQIACTAISGGKDSTDGEPNHVTLEVKRPGAPDKSIRYRRIAKVACQLCNGQGFLSPDCGPGAPCYTCNGTGDMEAAP